MARFGRLARWTATAALLALAPAASAQAATITIYNNQAAWAAAVGAITTEDFADAVLVPGLSITGGSVSISGGVMNDQINDDAATSTTFGFAPPILGFGGLFNLAGPGGQGSGIRVNVNFFGGGSQLVGDIPASTAGTFWGFTSDTAVSSVLFSETNPGVGVESYNLDNLQFSAAAAPEPATLALLGLGAAVLSARRRTKRS
jgi:hypothetical protein